MSATAALVADNWLGKWRSPVWNLTEPSLYEYAISAGKNTLGRGGALCAETPTTEAAVRRTSVPSSTISHAIQSGGMAIAKCRRKTSIICSPTSLKHAKGKKPSRRILGGADPKYRIKTRIFTELAWHSLFIRQLLSHPEVAAPNSETSVPDLTILDFPSFKPDAKRHGGREGSDTMVAFCVFTRKIVLICGSSYAGERSKKSVFTTLNFYLPRNKPSALLGQCQPRGRERVGRWSFGNGQRPRFRPTPDDCILIGDDETGSGPDGIFNFEGGCYAKTIKLSKEAEPMIWDATNRFGGVLENVMFDPVTRVLDYDDGSKTENTRSAYPLDFVPNASRLGRAGTRKT